MNDETATTDSWRQPRRTNSPNAATHCSTCSLESGLSCTTSLGGTTRRNFHKARVRTVAAAGNLERTGIRST